MGKNHLKERKTHVIHIMINCAMWHFKSWLMIVIVKIFICILWWAIKALKIKQFKENKSIFFFCFCSVQIRQFPWNSQGRCSAWISDCLSGTAGYSQTVAPAETEPQAAHDYSHTAASLDWYFRLPGGHDHHVSGLLYCCEEFPTLNINMLLESMFLSMFYVYFVK